MGLPITDIVIIFSSSYAGYETAVFTNSGNTPADLNDDAGGEYIYLHFKHLQDLTTTTLNYIDSNGTHKIFAPVMQIANIPDIEVYIP